LSLTLLTILIEILKPVAILVIRPALICDISINISIKEAYALVGTAGHTISIRISKPCISLLMLLPISLLCPVGTY